MSLRARLDKTDLRAVCGFGTCGGLLAPLRKVRVSSDARLLLSRGTIEVEVEQVRTLGLSLIGAERDVQNGVLVWRLDPRVQRQLQGGSRVAFRGWRVIASAPASATPPCQRAECRPPPVSTLGLDEGQRGANVRVTVPAASGENGETTTWIWSLSQPGSPRHWHGEGWKPEPLRVEIAERELPSMIACPRCRRIQLLDASALRLDGPPVAYKIVPL